MLININQEFNEMNLLSALKNILLIFFLSLTLISSGQKMDNTKDRIRDYVREIPATAEKDASRLAEVLTEPWDKDWQKAYAIYYWTANNIEYDLRLTRNPGTFNDPSELIDYVLKKGKGICQHYAEIFHYMSEEAGITSAVVSGYTKQNNEINDLPHAWNALLIDGEWYLFDPTWASGYIDGSKVKKRFSDEYFMMQPEQMIKTHMPFDPLFQFLEKPLSNEDFYRNNYRDPSLDKINYRKEVEEYLNADKETQLRQSLKRIEEAGIVNEMIMQEANHRVESLNILMKNQQVNVHNRAVELYNEAVREFNYYLEAKNNNFKKPSMSDEEIMQTMNSVEEKAVESKELFQQVRAPEEMLRTINKNFDNLNDLLRQLEKEKKFAEKYVNTAKPFRPLVK